MPDEVRSEIGPYFAVTPDIEEDERKLSKLDNNTAQYICTGLTVNCSFLYLFSLWKGPTKMVFELHKLQIFGCVFCFASFFLLWWWVQSPAEMEWFGCQPACQQCQIHWLDSREFSALESGEPRAFERDLGLSEGVWKGRHGPLTECCLWCWLMPGMSSASTCSNWMMGLSLWGGGPSGGPSTPKTYASWAKFWLRMPSASGHVCLTVPPLYSCAEPNLGCYLREITMLVDSIASINGPVSQQDTVHYTVLGLGREYKTLVTTHTCAHELGLWWLAA